jgi:ABC-type lipoprotein release transport system permease subunit
VLGAVHERFREVAALDALGARQHRIRDFEFSPEWDAA